MALPEEHTEIYCFPIYHYDFVNQQGRAIRTTKYIGYFAQLNKDYFIEGTTDMLNDFPLYMKADCKGYYDGKKWVICYVPKK